MNTFQKLLLITTLLAPAALVFTGCGDKASPVQSAEQAAVTSITITSNDLMRFSPESFTVPAGQEITLKLVNIGKMPKESMGHNLVILQQGVSTSAFAAAALSHPDNDYVPPQFQDQVIAATRVLGPAEEQSITFNAPTQPGSYPFICSFPGHTPARMVGTMIVR